MPRQTALHKMGQRKYNFNQNCTALYIKWRIQKDCMSSAEPINPILICGTQVYIVLDMRACVKLTLSTHNPQYLNPEFAIIYVVQPHPLLKYYIHT